MYDLSSLIVIALGGLGVFLLGVSKTGFGGGGGNLAVPLMVLLVSARETVAILLPVLCVADLFALWFYRFKWNYKVIKIITPTSIIGIIIGSILLGSVSNLYLGKIIGFIAVGFVVIQFLKYKLALTKEAYNPKGWHGMVFGGASGIVSTITHSAGPLLSVFLLPMELRKEAFVATTVLYFAIVNYIKLVPYTVLGILNINSILFSVLLLPFVPLGTYAGFRLNRLISSEHFAMIIYIILLFTGIQLISGYNVMEVLLSFF